MNCPKCGVEVKPEQEVCACGANLKEVKEVKEVKEGDTKKKGIGKGCIIAIVIAFFLFIFMCGVLAAIVYPQYVRAVEKSRLSEAIAISDAIVHAEAINQMMTTQYTNNFADLDIDLPGTINGSNLETDLYNFQLSAPNIKIIRKTPAKFEYTITRSMSTGEVSCQGDEFVCRYF